MKQHFSRFNDLMLFKKKTKDTVKTLPYEVRPLIITKMHVIIIYEFLLLPVTYISVFQFPTERRYI